MTATAGACCGNCKFWAPNYDPTQLDLDDAPHGSLPVVKQPQWGWCTESIPGGWLGYKKHKQQVPQVGVETHYEGCCEEHADKPCGQQSD